MPGQCCVFQIFDDGGAYDKRYDEVILPAIKAADLEPYRVDRDAGAEIPIDTLHEEIRRSAVCLADITPNNPNVWYELGFAVASDQPIVMICKKGRTLPFDTHHRSTIFYTQESPRDFEHLKNEITSCLKAALETGNSGFVVGGWRSAQAGMRQFRDERSRAVSAHPRNRGSLAGGLGGLKAGGRRSPRPSGAP